jgi:hypothetical protein
MPRWSGRDGANVGALFVLWLICAPVAWFFVQLTVDVPVRSAKVAAAAFGWHGEKGTVTVSHEKEVYEGNGRGGGSKKRYCYGDFRPADGGRELTGIRVHLSGDCAKGREVAARLIRADLSSWMIPDKEDDAYAGSGWGVAIVLMLFMGLFCLLVGGLFMLCAATFPVLMVAALVRRLRT